MVNELATISSILGVSAGVLVLFVIWSFIWKGIALWTAARKNSKVWFIILLIVNTLGILEILYIFLFSRIGERPRAKQEAKEVKLVKKRRR